MKVKEGAFVFYQMGHVLSISIPRFEQLLQTRAEAEGVLARQYLWLLEQLQADGALQQALHLVRGQGHVGGGCHGYWRLFIGLCCPEATYLSASVTTLSRSQYLYTKRQLVIKSENMIISFNRKTKHLLTI